jgi:tRNA pseudouridine synthase D (TruD)
VTTLAWLRGWAVAVGVMLSMLGLWQAALGTMCRMLHVKPNIFAVAGTKDRRAITAQLVTAYKLSDARLANLNAHLRSVLLLGWRLEGPRKRHLIWQSPPSPRARCWRRG